jgi:hypothetical protein
MNEETINRIGGPENRENMNLLLYKVNSNVGI